MPNLLINPTSKTPHFTKPKKPLPLTLIHTLASAQGLTRTNLLSAFSPSDKSPTIDNPKEEPQKDKPSADQLATPFSLYGQNLANVKPQPVRWLWQKRLPLSGITLLDGDHGCGKSLLALQIAASVSSGNPMPDGSPTIQGGVVIVSPHTDSNTTQLQTLIALGANLSRIEILSFIQEPDPEHPTPSHRPFSLPEDLTHLFAAIQRVDARLVIFDPFIHLLSYESRWTDQRLYHLLTDLNQFLIEHGVACLITRNCHAKGGHARPSMLERSDHFVAISVSLLLLAPDPMHPNHPLLSHAINRHGALTQTCSLQIQPLPDHPDLPHITFHGYHSLLARDFIENRLDVLHRRLLSQQLLGFITDATDPIHVSTLYALLPHCSAFQIQRSLSDLLRTEQIERPARGFYAKPPTNPTFVPPNTTAATTHHSPPTNILNGSPATTHKPPTTNTLNDSPAITHNTPPTNILNDFPAITYTQPEAVNAP